MNDEEKKQRMEWCDAMDKKMYCAHSLCEAIDLLSKFEFYYTSYREYVIGVLERQAQLDEIDAQNYRNMLFPKPLTDPSHKE